MSDAVVVVDDLTFSYGTGRVLHGISFTLKRGEVAGLLGPNGAGKSTTIKVLTGVLPPGGGSVRVAGHALPEEAVEAKRRIGYVPEAAALFESLTGQEFLELMGRLQDVPEERLQFRIGRFLEQFGLTDDRLRPLDGYSKGMRQKVLLSAALLHNPDVVLLDEPLSGLDVNAGLMVRDLVAALAAEGRPFSTARTSSTWSSAYATAPSSSTKAASSPTARIEALKASTARGSLEDVFRQLTDTEGTVSGVSRIVEALRS